MLLRCVVYSESMRDEWDRFALTGGTIFHTIAFREVLLKSFGYTCAYYAVLDQDDRICALIPLVVGRDLGLKKTGVALPFVNYADICADSEASYKFAVLSIQELRERLQLSYIELRFKDQSIDNPLWNQQLDNFTFVLPLSEHEDQVLGLASGSCRNHVRKAYKNQWFEVSLESARLDDFYRIYVKRMHQLGSPSPDICFFRNFFAYMPDHTFLLTVLDKQSSDVVGGMLLLLSPGNETVYYPYGANLVEYNGKYLNNFMYWEAVRFAIGKGMKYLDLGRSQAGSGTYKFKEHWGAKPTQLTYQSYNGGREFAGSPDRKKLSFFVELWKRTPRLFTDPIGKQLIRYLMP